MANTILSPTIITREALRYLHNNLNFINNINKQYDNQFANSGASPSGKIGPTLTIRMPNQFTTRTGWTRSNQDIAETSQVLTVSTVKGVDFTFSAADMTLTIDEFGKRYLKPAMATLAANIEADALSMVLDVYNAVDDNANPITYKDFALGRQKLQQYLAPDDGERVGLLCSAHVPSYLDAIKGLFNPQESMGKSYLTGKVGKVSNINTFENTILPTFQTGTAAATTGYTVNGASQTGASITVQTGTTTFLKGDLVTFAGCFAVNAETKAAYSFLQQFVVTANSGASATTLAISPAIVVTGAGQNVSASPTNTGAVVKLGGGASATYNQSILFHPDAFTFVTADLVDPSQYGAKGSRQVMDGISMTLAQQYAISDASVPARLDVLYGYKTLRPQLAARVIAQ